MVPASTATNRQKLNPACRSIWERREWTLDFIFRGLFPRLKPGATSSLINSENSRGEPICQGAQAPENGTFLCQRSRAYETGATEVAPTGKNGWLRRKLRCRSRTDH